MYYQMNNERLKMATEKINFWSYENKKDKIK